LIYHFLRSSSRDFVKFFLEQQKQKSPLFRYYSPFEQQMNTQSSIHLISPTKSELSHRLPS
ncbi:hypothetical protein, partial [Enterococcus asini]|uniref:hypothetical protein n=1 Tax=Enterococcus asini TaxID=57732 RepID=UPI001B80C1E1